MLLNSLVDENRRQELRAAVSRGQPIVFRRKLPKAENLASGDATGIPNIETSAFSRAIEKHSDIFSSHRYRENSTRLAEISRTSFTKTDIDLTCGDPGLLHHKIEFGK